MPEAYGSVVIVASEEIIDEFKNCGESISWELMTKLFNYAGIKSIQDSDDMLSFCNKDEGFHQEGVEVKNSAVNITIFGSEWMDISKVLIKQGKGIQLYGRINHEYGADEFYALNADGKSYTEVIDYEGEYNVDREDGIFSEWIGYVPQDMLASFPEVFSNEEEDEDYEEDD
ncbi:hypothetical protein ACFL2V_19315 [Pseudomonadota bacterium]